MAWADLLYGLTNRDTGAVFLETITRQSAATALATTIDIDFAVPLGRILDMTCCAAQAEAGAGQLCTSITIGVLRPTGEFVEMLRDVEAARALAVRILRNDGSRFYVRSGDTLRARAIFNGLVNANTLRFSWGGSTIPLGNVAGG